VTDVGQVEFTVLPVPPAAAELVPLEPAAPDAAVVELELEQAATAVTVTTAAAASLVHLNMRGLRTNVPLSGSPSELAGALFTWRNQGCKGNMTGRLRRKEPCGKRPGKVHFSCRLCDVATYAQDTLAKQWDGRA
jgi:hypothetical protein